MQKRDLEAERIQALELLIEVINKRASQDLDFKRAAKAIPSDLHFIKSKLAEMPEVWRLNRSFHAVHVPSLIAVVSVLDQVDNMTCISKEERHQFNASLYQAAQLAKMARERIEQADFGKTKIELEVLANYAPEPLEPFQPASVWERGLNNLSSVAGQALTGAKNQTAQIPNLASKLKDNAASSLERTIAISTLAGNAHKTLFGTLSDKIAQPINMRLSASNKALKHGLGAGIGLGVVAGILCPPLLPVSAAGGVLAAMRGWRLEMDTLREVNAGLREQRITDLQIERSAALQKLANGASAIQMETEDLNLTVNTQTGEADAVILTGDHIGESWSNLSTFEKAQAVASFADTAATLLNILDFDS